MGKIVLATIIISGSAKWLLNVDGNKEKWYGSDRIFMYVMTVFGAMTVNYSEQCTEYGWVVSNLRLLAGCLLAGGLLSAAYMDRRNCWVYNYVWWWCLPWAGILGMTAGNSCTIVNNTTERNICSRNPTIPTAFPHSAKAQTENA